MQPNISRFLDFTIGLTNVAGKKLLENFRHNDPADRGTSKEVKSTFDKIADTLIKNMIEKTFPDHSYITEETGYVNKNSDYLWIEDPLDGTGNFANHNPFFSVSIALWHSGKPIMGVIYAPALQERFVGITGAGAYREDLILKTRTPLKVSDVSDIQKSYFVFCEGGERRRERLTGIFSTLYPKMKDTRKLGSAAIELAWVAGGRAEGYVTTNISLWDIAAGIILIKEAGGAILKFDGTPYDWSEFKPEEKFDLLTTNGRIQIRPE